MQGTISTSIEQPAVLSSTVEENNQTNQRIAQLEAELEQLQHENTRYESLCKQLQEIIAQQQEEDDESEESESVEEKIPLPAVAPKRKAEDMVQTSSTIKSMDKKKLASSSNKSNNKGANVESSQKKQKK